MWKPSDRIQWQSHAPAASAAAADSPLFRPVTVNRFALKTRSWYPAVVSWRASEDGHVTPSTLAWYRRIAMGRPGAIVVEAAGIRDIPSGPLLRLSHDRYVAGMAELVATIRQASGGETKVFVQLIDFLNIRRRPEPDRFLTRFLVITDRHRALLGETDDTIIRDRLKNMSRAELETILDLREREALDYGARERITDVHLPWIKDLPDVLPDLFANAALRARDAGFDGVELHYAHAYTMASFLSALNTRGDGWGQTREGRVRLAEAVLDSVRGRVGPDYPVGCRLLAEECIAGGSTVEDAAWFSGRLAARGLDFLSLSRGGKFEDALQPRVGEAAYPYTGPSGYECIPHAISDSFGPFGRNAKASRFIRAQLRSAGFDTPVICAGGVHTVEMAETMLADGTSDVVASARQFMADPDWLLKARAGRADSMRVCKYTNYCEGLDQKHKAVTCRLWDRTALNSPDTRLCADGKRRLEAPV
ncbi:NADH oxidase [Komagataeibacter saccharivorans]|uniref:NADH oxidase n=1 Tax=Komagataeibacter saccharivorans TaxID=265959 RepID=A0A347WEB0_9PROT|nr:NADH oxidase [Komagataeibacter saccharivorans]